MRRKKRSGFLKIAVALSVLVALLASIVVLVPGLVSGLASPRIGIIKIHGPVSIDSSNDLFGSQVSSQEIVSLIEKAQKDPRISVIFLDINSPGGSVVASKQIAYAVRNSSKPVVAYINDIGTSGAYYIASASDLVIADEDSLTGSIGVLMELDNYADLLEKLGLNVTILKKGKFKDIGNPARPTGLTEEERKILDSIVDLAYQHFKRDLLSFRGDKIRGNLEEIADGRPLTGLQAKELGLVDELGTRSYALERAWSLANRTGRPITEELEEEKLGIFDLLKRVGYSLGEGFIVSLKTSTLNWNDFNLPSTKY